MAPRLPVRRSVLPLLIAVAMTAGSSIATSALGPGPTRPSPTPESPASVNLAARWSTPAPRGPWSVATRPGYRFPRALAAPVVVAKAAPPKAAPKPKPAKPKPPKATPRPTRHVTVGSTYKGRNHAWIPALGLNRSVSWYPCGATRAPGLGLYRWGCAGANNVYLLAHAFSWFKPLNQAYYAHGLHRGQLAVYADHAGHIHYYHLDYWRVGPPTEGQHWAWDAQSHSVLTLQTCVGAHSESRLFVRFHEVARA
jgi:hypothetical protein